MRYGSARPAGARSSASAAPHVFLAAQRALRAVCRVSAVRCMPHRSQRAPLALGTLLVYGVVLGEELVHVPVQSPGTTRPIPMLAAGPGTMWLSRAYIPAPSLGTPGRTVRRTEVARCEHSEYPRPWHTGPSLGTPGRTARGCRRCAREAFAQSRSGTAPAATHLNRGASITARPPRG